jgi:hypothetical protein
METRDEIFDDANGDLAIGELEAAVEKYRRCVELDPQFFDGLACARDGAHEDRPFP